MEWRILETPHGYYAEYGRARGEETVPCVMNDFFAVVSVRFDTFAQAQSYIQRMKKTGPYR